MINFNVIYMLVIRIYYLNPFVGLLILLHHHPLFYILMAAAINIAAAHQATHSLSHPAHSYSYSIVRATLLQ